MKTLLILILLSTLTLCKAIPARFAWTPNPEDEGITEYRIHELNALGQPVLRATVVAPFNLNEKGKVISSLMEVESGQKYTVTAYNGFVSEHSDPYTVPKLPSKPGAMELIVERSIDLKTWETKLVMPVEPTEPAEFFRIRLVQKQNPST